MTPQQALQKYWGYDHFRPLQEEIVNSVLAGRDTLALLPTGGGKSICYQVPALINDGFCLVISPLIALMQDQVARLTQVGIPAACIHSGLPYKEVKRMLEQAMNGAFKLLYVSPERLQTYLFTDYMTSFDVNLIAVDESHCISQWGHDFRPSYLKIASIRSTFPSAPVLALTATATADVRADIIQSLELKEPAIFRQSFARTNIFYDVKYSENKHGDMLENIGADCGIIYTRSRKQTEAIGSFLEQMGKTAAVYHAGLPREKREEQQALWMEDKSTTMVATTAFGMGIDKPDVRMVLHYDAPEHLEAYYQEAGRGGRDGKQAYALALYNSSDVERLRESTALKYPPESYLRQVYQGVVEYLQIPIGGEPDQYYSFDIDDFSRKFSLRANHAIHALKLLEQEGLWTLSESVYSPSTIQFITDRHALDNVARVHPDLGYVTVGLLRMYNSIFYFPTQVRETAIARQLKMKKEELLPILDQLNKMEVLEYIRPGEGPQLFFHHYRVDSRHLIIDLNRINVLRERHEKRTEAMIAFLQNKSMCRERLVLRWFGEKVNDDCGHCDVCRDRMDLETRAEGLEMELLALLQNQGKSTLQYIITTYPPVMKDRVVSVVRRFIDEGTIALKDGLLSVSE